MHFLKGHTDYTVSLELETVSSKVSASIQTKEQGKSFLAVTLSQGLLVDHKVQTIQC